MKAGYDNIIAELMVQSCRASVGQCWSSQAAGMVKALADSLDRQLSNSASESLKIGSLHRGGSILKTSQRGGRRI